MFTLLSLLTIVGTLFVGIGWFIARLNGEPVVTSIVSDILSFIYPIRNARGESIAGPRWKWPNGQCIEKFLDGRECSRVWSRYGAVYRVWAGTIPEVVITKPEDVRVFHSDSPHHNKARSSNAGWMFHELLGDCMGLINGTRWKKLRGEWEPFFAHHGVRSYSSSIESDARGYVKSMVATETAGATSFDVHSAHAISRFPFMCTAEYIYGPLTDAEKEKLWSIGQKSLGLMVHVLNGGAFRYELGRPLEGKATQELINFRHEWMTFNDQIYQAKKTVSSPPPIVQAWNQVLNGEIPMSETLQTLSEMLFANLDVSTHVLSWLVALVAESSSVQEQLREEIRKNVDDPDAYYRRKDTLLHLCFLESLRLRPFTVFTIPESSPTEKVLGGYVIPPNTSVVVDTLKINHNEAFWGKDSHMFNPSRLQHVKPAELRYNLFTFGFGTRKCLGQHFADSMMKAFLFHLVSQYKISQSSSALAEKVADDSKTSWTPISDVKIDLQRIE
ncbi:cytochrome P450 [Xylona heveae TC161]|uniref:Cytochrome P450 n=1 Tax=Xylona heveae (strain CBS 132557 / TC161) TaxID=1328760 RepID=A0A165HTY8_XYLHT|nr:cytochrome P450 [Xylona heveae TC161]KZF23923.1 cytochrome P450 [Xylona heveae TC161]